MFAIALGLSAANIILLAMAFTVGLSALDVESGAMTVYSTHIAIGIACGLMCALTHVAIFTYFMATSKWLQAAVDKGGMQYNDFVAPSLSRKIRVLAAGLVAIGGTLAAMIGGAGCDPTVNILWPAGIHLALAISAIIINIIVALIELRLVSDQVKLIDKALIILNTLPTPQPSTA